MREAWVITDGAAGNERQALALAQALDVPARVLALPLRNPWAWAAPRRLPGGRLALAARDRLTGDQPVLGEAAVDVVADQVHVVAQVFIAASAGAAGCAAGCSAGAAVCWASAGAASTSARAWAMKEVVIARMAQL